MLVEGNIFELPQSLTATISIEHVLLLCIFLESSLLKIEKIESWLKTNLTKVPKNDIQ